MRLPEMVLRIKGSLYTFVHNSVSSLRDCIPRVLEKHPDIAAGKGTVFIAVESLYSMDGDFAPLPEIVRLTKELVPHGCAHIVVDEALSTGIYGPRPWTWIATSTQFSILLVKRVHL